MIPSFRSFNVLVVLFVMAVQLLASEEEAEYRAVIDRPESHVWDRDSLFRNHPELIPSISKFMKDLERDEKMEVFLVIYSSLIGEKPNSLANRCHEAWLGETNDGLVFVVSFNEEMAGEVGCSRGLYEGRLIDKGLMSRLSFHKLQEIIFRSINKVRDEEDELVMLRIFIESVTGDIREHLELRAEEDASRESYHFMGWMALALIVCGVLMAFLSRIMGAVDRKSKKSYRFPDFTVPQRLRAPNGGGKIGVVDFKEVSDDQQRDVWA